MAPRNTTKRKKPGRKPLPGHVVRHKRVAVAVSDSEEARIAKRAEEAGLPPSVYMRVRSLGD